MNPEESSSHPALNARLQLIDDFSNNRDNAMITMFQKACELLALPRLEIQFRVPDIKASFDDLRPYAIQNEKEMYGLLVAAWDYLESLYPKDQQLPKPWQTVEGGRREQILNGLVEKSVRNYIIKNKWNHYAPSDQNPYS